MIPELLLASLILAAASDGESAEEEAWVERFRETDAYRASFGLGPLTAAQRMRVLLGQPPIPKKEYDRWREDRTEAKNACRFHLMYLLWGEEQVLGGALCPDEGFWKTRITTINANRARLSEAALDHVWEPQPTPIGNVLAPVTIGPLTPVEIGRIRKGQPPVLGLFVLTFSPSNSETDFQGGPNIEFCRKLESGNWKMHDTLFIKNRGDSVGSDFCAKVYSQEIYLPFVPRLKGVV
jgi:hypothetical protein